MINQKMFILILVLVLIVAFVYSKNCERFETINDYPCSTHPLNSNCTCPPEAPIQTVLGEFPMNYGEKAPYVYTCVPKTAQEPATTVWSSPQ